MVAPNIVDVQAIKSFFLSWDLVLGKNVILINPENSGQIFKITDIKLSNFESFNTSVSVVLERDNIEYHLIKNVNINENSTISIITAESEIILQEGDRIICYSDEEQQGLSISISYSVISETSSEHERRIFSLSAPSEIGSNETLEINFISRNIPDGQISYEITGVTTEDIDNFPLTGSFTLTNGQAQIQLNIQESAEEKTLVFSIPSLSASISIGIVGSLYNFTSFTFTNGTQTGRLGPSLQNLLSSYDTNENDWLNDTEFFNTSSGIQLWTVPADGTYRIEAFGAEGGGGGAGGLGARMRGDFQLTEGEIIRILVGQQGEDNGFHGGGGGGSFVVRTPYNTNQSILVIAGGGGSISGRYNNSQSDPNSIGRVETSGGSGFRTGSGGLGTPGTAGQGGTGDSTAYGGAGFFGNGDGGAQSFTSGGGGDIRTADGGFGGGGGANTGWDRNGGGGGYSGGAGARGSTGSRAGGGGSFNSGVNQDNQSGAHSGHGKVEITFLG